ncbi:predicted protein [Naegleria gruberi]|uniref:RNA helicase n=1 Tax=Naegleria gruberi TaxID=5762 RepID=D2W436_NAEGR|nr:uncharacterized protein NAEGRDRAFT_82293 [Naegleria gruberi]EFC36193.1 predicted protein [Naegleria gruberi]|eukprot:XP_002668937.1 predicted protein [Naegleria gruberi strain NEG-M]
MSNHQQRDSYHSSHHHNDHRGYRREGSSNYSSEGSRHPSSFNNNNFGPPSSSYRSSRNDDHQYRYNDNNRQYNRSDDRSNNLKRSYDDYKQETNKTSESSNNTNPQLNTTATTTTTSSNNTKPTTTTTTTSDTTNTTTTTSDENEKKKARLEAWKKKKEMGALQKLEEEKKQKVPVPPPKPVKKPLSFGTKKTVNNNIKISVLNMDDDEEETTTKQTNSLSFLEEEENVNTNMSDDEDDDLEKYMSSIHSELKQSEKPKEIDNGTLSNENTDLNSSEIRNQKGQVLFSDDTDDVDLDSYFIAKDDITNRNLEGLSEFQKQSKKDLKQVDHSKMEYLPFRKNFFIVPREYANMSENDIAELRKEMGNIKVHGHDIPPPVKTWTQCGLNDTILGVLETHGYTKPFAIQSQALPCIMSGRNIIGIAKTGSGKTLAFVLPMLRHVLDQPPLKTVDGPIGIVMAPTRELAMQIHSDIEKFSAPLMLKTACVYGGAGIAEQIALLKNGAHIIVCTPGRLIDLLCANRGRVTNLTRDLVSAGYRENVCTLDGSMEQIERDCTISDFKSQKFNIMVGTSVCSRGLDVPSIRLVVNYNCPDHYEDYIHKVGRTGRAGKKGVAYTFISTDEEKYAPDLVKALKQSNNPVPEDLQKLCDNYLTKRNLGLVQGQKKNALPGFVGTGYKFDEKEEKQKMEEKKQMAFSYALTNNDDTILDQIDIQEVDETKKKDKSQKKKSKKEETVVDRATKAADAVYKDIEKDDTITEEEKAIQRAQLFAAALTVHTSISEKQKEKELSQMILAGVVNINGLFRTEVEINDWPRGPRSEVLKKDSLHSIQHFTNTKIQIKGTYIPPETKPQKGERKQYLIVEGADEGSVHQARTQILSVLGESASALGDKRVTGRFQIV